MSLIKKDNVEKFIQIGLAPMEGVTCLATRLWFSVTSQPDFAMTPFLRVTQDYPWKRVASTYAAEIFDLKKLTSYSLIPQLMGTSPTDIERIALPLLKETSFVDINCGCPSPKVVGHHAGSGLLENKDVFEIFLKNIEERIGKNLFSIKMRSGFISHDEFPSLLKLVANVKMSQLTLHARTRDERYRGMSRWDLIDLASKTCPFPVIGSGDIVSSQSLKLLLEKASGVCKVIVGRGALRNPWIFHELRSNESVFLTVETLLYSLACFAILQDMLAIDYIKLFSLVESGIFLQNCGTNQTLWENLYLELCSKHYGNYIPIHLLQVEKASFARVKMIWNTLRSSLGDEFMNPKLLRVSSFSDFFYGVLHIVKQQRNHMLHLKYHSEYDWMYSGVKNQEKKNSANEIN